MWANNQQLCKPILLIKLKEGIQYRGTFTSLFNDLAVIVAKLRRRAGLSTRCQVCLNPMMFLLLPWKKCPRWEQSCTERLLLENKSTKRTAKEAATRLWSCMLLLHLTPTCADALCNLILGTSTLVHVVVHPLQLALVVFFIQPLTQILYLQTWW